jgi:hypothetical protein
MSETKSFTKKIAEYINFLTSKQLIVDLWPKTDTLCLFNENRTLAVFPTDYDIDSLVNKQNGEPFLFDGSLLTNAISILDDLKESGFDVTRIQNNFFLFFLKSKKE